MPCFGHIYVVLDKDGVLEQMDPGERYIDLGCSMYDNNEILRALCKEAR